MPASAAEPSESDCAAEAGFGTFRLIPARRSLQGSPANGELRLTGRHRRERFAPGVDQRLSRAYYRKPSGERDEAHRQGLRQTSEFADTVFTV